MLQKNWKRVVGQNVRNLTKDQALEILKQITEHQGIGCDAVRKLTGGYSSQAVDYYVIQKLSKKIK